MIFFFDNFKISLRYGFHILNIHRDVFFYLNDIERILIYEIIYRRDISCRYSIDILSIFHRYPIDIPSISHRYPINIPSTYIIYNENKNKNITVISLGYYKILFRYLFLIILKYRYKNDDFSKNQKYVLFTETTRLWITKLGDQARSG